MSTRFELTDAEWSLIEPLLPREFSWSQRADDRRVLNGIFYVLRKGCPWRELPKRYGPYTTCYSRYNRWAKQGLWKTIFDRLARRSPHSLHLIDSTIVEAHRAAGGANWRNRLRLLDAHAAAARLRSDR